MFTALRRITKAGFVGFWRNAYVSLASIFVITVVLFVIGATIFVDRLLVTSLQILQSKVDISVFFIPTASQADIDALITSVSTLPDVADVRYTTREEALAQYRDRNRNNEITLQVFTELGVNPLGANIAIQATDLTRYEAIDQFLIEQQAASGPQNQIIEYVNYGSNKKAIDTLTSTKDAVERGSFIIMLVLMAAAVLITFNTVRLAIYTSREEISIMRLVGASNMFIRGPFIIQGIMYGFVAGVLAIALWYPALIWLGPRTEVFLEFNLFAYFVANFGYIFAVLVGTGVVLGLVSSTMAIARYLRV